MWLIHTGLDVALCVFILRKVYVSKCDIYKLYMIYKLLESLFYWLFAHVLLQLCTHLVYWLFVILDYVSSNELIFKVWYLNGQLFHSCDY